jgi:predicted phosphodiesterase
MKLGLITDIHELTTSLERALSQADRMGCGDIACLGDITGYDADLYPEDPRRSASECIRLVRENCRWVVAGNHDREIPAGDRLLPDADSDYLSHLPDHLIIQPEDQRILLSHYLFPDFTGASMLFVRKLNQLDAAHEFMMEMDIRLSFAGHDHPAGVGFGYPSPAGWGSRLKKAFHYLPYHRYDIDGQLLICLLPAVASRSGRPGLSVWDTTNRTLDVLQTDH